MPPSSEHASLHELVRFLQDPASYPHAPATVRIIQTHISVVAIASPYVYKIKKPVDFGFLDFSTLARRKHFCEEEVRLNRRLCARIYEGISPISRREGRLVWGEGDEVVDYAVVMHELDPRFFLDEMLRRGELTAGVIDRVADTLASFYRSLPPVFDPPPIETSIDENFAQTAGDVDQLLTPASFHALRHYASRFLRTNQEVFERRRREGRFVEGHGDLRLEHVHAGPDGLCIYDTIEFSTRLRTVDVANDLAFLGMDLDFHGRHDLARHLANRMAQELDDPDLPALLPFYACYRAHVRAKVEAMRGDETEVPASDREASRLRARRLYAQALRYATLGGRPTVIVVMGRIGTGKSTLARALAEALDVDVVSSDLVRKQQAGVPPYERTGDALRPWLYTAEKTDAVYATLRETALQHAHQGKSTVLDATFGSRTSRKALRGLLESEDIPAVFIEVSAPDTVIRERLARRATEAGVVSDARLEDFEALSARYETPASDEAGALFCVESGPDLETTLTRALLHLVDRHFVAPP